VFSQHVVVKLLCNNVGSCIIQSFWQWYTHYSIIRKQYIILPSFILAWQLWSESVHVFSIMSCNVYHDKCA